MERHRITSRTFNGRLSQRPSLQANVSSHISLPPKSPVPSYSCPETLRNPNAAAADAAAELNIFDAERYFNDVPEKKPITLNGIAERCDVSTNPRKPSASSTDGYGRNWRNGTFYATPTASSEASWNSRSGLLTNPLGSVAASVRAFPINEGRKATASSKRKLFRRNCPCSGEKSVDVEEFSELKTPARSIYGSNGSLGVVKPSFKAVEAGSDAVVEKGVATKETERRLGMKEEVTKLKIVAGNWRKEEEVFGSSAGFSPKKHHFPTELAQRILNPNKPFNDAGGFSFPILNPSAINCSADDPARESLDVFRPSEEVGILWKSAGFERKTITNFTYPASPKARAGEVEDDIASDTSSDLFEIESFSTQYRRRDSLDELPIGLAGRANGNILRLQRSIEEVGGAPSECYAPSEASVEWSVTTAEGFDRGSVTNFSSGASEFDEFRYAGAQHDRLAAAIAAGGGRKRSNGLLMNCRCEKAVSVGPSPVPFVPDQRRVRAPPFLAEPERIHGATKVGGRHAAQDRAGLARSYSARMSRPLSAR